MSEHELYEIARKRIDQRNRRWTIWGIDLAGLILTLAVLLFLSETAYVMIGAALFIAWAGMFTFHTIFAVMAQSRDQDIETEVAKLRSAIASYEKPKRIELAEDGELIEHDDWEIEEAQRQRLS